MGAAKRQYFPFSVKERYGKQRTNDAFRLQHQSIAKCKCETSPYLIPNEWVAGRIAQFLCLPIPPFALTRRTARSTGYFASLEYGGQDTPPLDADPAACVDKLPELSVGILLFDILIANPDRHSENLRVDDRTNPRDMIIIDHERSLLGCFPEEGCDRLKKLRNRLGASGGELTSENRHCFLDLIRNDEHFSEWLHRIKSLPDWYIKDACDYVVGVGCTREEADAVCEFLVYRRTSLTKIVDDHKDEFTGMRGGWSLFR